MLSSDDHDGVPPKIRHCYLQKERASVAKYKAQQQKPKENIDMQEHRILSEDAKQVESCSTFDVKVPNQVFAALNISCDQPSDTVYWNSGTTPGFQPQPMPDNFTQVYADNKYPRDQQQSRHLFGSKWVTHSKRRTKGQMLSTERLIVT